jgi:phosphatidylglycerol---prolipoprotein diacylglyceryl transferase
MLGLIPYPDIDPIIFQIGPIAIRWYALAYIGGLMLGIWHLRKLSQMKPAFMKGEDADDFLTWATLGVILGGRFGYILFYKFAYYLDDPLQMLYVWKGGMSFHGGFLGVLIAGIIFTRKRKIPPLRFADALACAAPIGLFFGRVANFINGELIGRAADVPWAMIFPHAGPDPRHPSQLYEAALEGVVLFAIVNLFWRNETFRARPGATTGVFVAGYALARGIAELFRQPDAHLGFLLFGSTMGQLLSVPMFLGGLYLIFRSKPAK